MPTIADRITRARIQLLRTSPFFATLLLHVSWREDTSIRAAVTDGSGLIINPDFTASLNDTEFNYLLMHEVLHCALRHVERLRDLVLADSVTANKAADIVVNGIMLDNNFVLPKQAITNSRIQHLSAREIYYILKGQLSLAASERNKHSGEKKSPKSGRHINECLVISSEQTNSSAQAVFIDNKGAAVSRPNWDEILIKAETIARMRKARPVGASLYRVFDEILEPQVDWRDVLFRYVMDSRSDYDGYDKRFISRGLYLDDLSSPEIRLLIFIDTSGSIASHDLRLFVSEIRAIASSTQDLNGQVYFFDAALHYLCEIQDLAEKPNLQGGGGTSFLPALAEISRIYDYEAHNSTVILPIIFTDGDANLDVEYNTSIPLLWVVRPGGVESKCFPYGDVCRLVHSCFRK
jgi:predicted metal-dependent peptidase